MMHTAIIWVTKFKTLVQVWDERGFKRANLDCLYTEREGSGWKAKFYKRR